MCGVKKLGAQTGPMMLMMLALAGLLGAQNALQIPTKRSNIHAVGNVCGFKYQCW